MSKLRVMRDVLFVLVITVAAMSMIQVTGHAAVDRDVTYEELAACEGLRCNDPSDCGSHCFCNNPSDTTGSCYKDEATILETLAAQEATNPDSY
jgi:hypothetical protein